MLDWEYRSYRSLVEKVPDRKQVQEKEPGSRGSTGAAEPMKKKVVYVGRGPGMAAVAVIAGVSGAAGACLYAIRPRDPVFEVLTIELKGFNLRFCTDSPMLMAVVDVELTLSIKVTNDNVAPIEYSSTIMDVFYRGSLLGQAKVEEGAQAARCSKVIYVPCKLDGLEMTNHVKDLFKDVTKREMMLHSVVTIAGHARVWKWTHNFEVHVTSDIKVDPIFLNVIDQENKVEMEFEPPL
ncbi:hypothetical protein R1sor_016812 [Riccia sorocarpa]|uniref:Late embryogenesis abundant protein LEA-2 subgroup domain-containing protein n=1 Tax=Riccia sorocarpa TaxID=122646 RepID=A0ABD3HGI4_9MARC